MLGKVGEQRFGYSEDEELIDRALSELLAAYEAKDGRRVIEAFDAIVHLILMKGDSDGDAHEEAGDDGMHRSRMPGV